MPLPLEREPLSIDEKAAEDGETAQDDAFTIVHE
jgi:hypothetical protein